ERRLVRYRGRPQICNACPRKPACTDSDDGREVVRFLDDWPRLEAGRFHRGLALTLVVLATFVTVAAVVRHHAPGELVGLGTVLLLAALAARRFAPAFRSAVAPGAPSSPGVGGGDTSGPLP
ncbi:MAG TPA: hypothetical protein VFL41_12240, partial [Gaiellaceae bacterium]|nr:hypothetical protein [Gaiellaceae bacterium]